MENQVYYIYVQRIEKEDQSKLTKLGVDIKFIYDTIPAYAVTLSSPNLEKILDLSFVKRIEKSPDVKVLD